jgi:cytochrome c2
MERFLMARWHERHHRRESQVVFLRAHRRGTRGSQRCDGVNLRAACLLGACAALSQVACSPATPDAKSRGRELLAQHHCGSCHVIPGVPAAQGRVAITLDAFGRRSYIAGRVPNTEANLARWMVNPADLVPGTTMPAMGVSPADARDMAAYLRSLQ